MQLCVWVFLCLGNSMLNSFAQAMLPLYLIWGNFDCTHVFVFALGTFVFVNLVWVILLWVSLFCVLLLGNLIWGCRVYEVGLETCVFGNVVSDNLGESLGELDTKSKTSF